jgi:uncharacterized integral membrane protein
MPRERRRAFLRTLIYGLISLTLFLLLFIYNAEILTYSAEGGWNFWLPITIAFLLSWAHGNFTGQFWELLGVRAKSTKK